MGSLTVIATIMYTIVAWSLVWNFIRLFTESKKLKANNQTPLTGKTSITIAVAAVAEALVVAFFIKLFSLGFIPPDKPLGVIFVFGSLSLVRNLASYLVTWGIWGFFVRSAKKKEIAKINNDLQKEKTGI